MNDKNYEFWIMIYDLPTKTKTKTKTLLIYNLTIYYLLFMYYWTILQFTEYRGRVGGCAEC